MKKILFLMIVVALSVLTLASCAWIGGENECAHEVTMPVGAGKAATCSEEGLTPGKKCADCGTVIEEQTAIAKLDHTIETIPAVEGSCTVKSKTAGEKCSVCGDVIKAPVEGDYKHSPVNVNAKEPTCTEDGYEAGVKCGDCGTVISGMATKPNKGGHDYGDDGECECGATEGGNQGGSTESGDQDGIMDTEWDTNV